MAPDPADNQPLIDTARCTGCGRCVAACPQRLITLETAGHRKHARLVQPKRCTRCGACRAACPVQAIRTTPFSP